MRRGVLLMMVLCLGVVLCAPLAGAQDEALTATLYAAEANLLAGRYEDAVAQFSEAIALSPATLRGYTGAAEAYFALGEWEAADRVLDLAYLRTGDAAAWAFAQRLLPEESRLPDVGMAQEEALPKGEPVISRQSSETMRGLAGPFTPGLLPRNAVDGGSARDVGVGIGQIAPDFTLDLMRGGTVTLWDLRGKPVFLNIFATWCGPCAREIPEIQRAYERYGDEVHFVGISSGESKQTVETFFEGRKCGYMIAFDNHSTLDEPYRIEYIPTSLMLDENGVVVDVLQGEATLPAIEAAIERAAAR